MAFQKGVFLIATGCVFIGLCLWGCDGGGDDETTEKEKNGGETLAVTCGDLDPCGEQYECDAGEAVDCFSISKCGADAKLCATRPQACAVELGCTIDQTCSSVNEDCKSGSEGQNCLKDLLVCFDE